MRPALCADVLRVSAKQIGSLVMSDFICQVFIESLRVVCKNAAFKGATFQEAGDMS